MASNTNGSTSGGSGRNTSYALLPSDRKAVSDASSFSVKFKNEIAEKKNEFENKGSWGLWWDAYGLFSSSDKTAVTQHMERYRKFYEDIVTCTDMVRAGDKSSYDKLLGLYAELDDIEMEAERDVKDTNSKAICTLLKEFLSSKYTLNHHLKKVECVVLRQTLQAVEETVQNSTDAIANMANELANLHRENQKKREEKEDLKKAMEEKMKELSLEADKRYETLRKESDRKLLEANAKAEERYREMFDKYQSDMQKVLELLAAKIKK